MYIIFKTSQGSIRVSGTYLILSAVATLLLFITIIRATDYNISDDTTYASIIMNATVSNYVGINLSAAMQRGILFGGVTSNTNDNMAENNTNHTVGLWNCTEYWIGNDPASSGTVALFHNASDMDRGGASDTILIANVTHESNTTGSGNNVNMTYYGDGSGGDVVMTTSYQGVGGGNCTSVAISASCYIAYWLDVPSNIPGGTYNTTYNYCGNLTNGGSACE